MRKIKGSPPGGVPSSLYLFLCSQGHAQKSIKCCWKMFFYSLVDSGNFLFHSPRRHAKESFFFCFFLVCQTATINHSWNLSTDWLYIGIPTVYELGGLLTRRRRAWRRFNYNATTIETAESVEYVTSAGRWTMGSVFQRWLWCSCNLHNVCRLSPRRSSVS